MKSKYIRKMNMEKKMVIHKNNYKEDFNEKDTRVCIHER